MKNKHADNHIVHFWEDVSNSPASNVFISIFNAINEGIEIVDSEGWVKYVNPAFLSITGLKEEDRVGKNILKIVPNGPLFKALKTGRPILGEKLKMKDAGIDIITNTSPIYIGEDMVGAVVIFQDVTEIKRLNEMLKESQQTIQVLHHKLSKVATAQYSFDDIIGNSRFLMRSLKIAKRAAITESTVLLTGESGTGKELFAHAIHNNSARWDQPFIKVNCAAIPDNLLESEFFGYEKGAFSGASRRKVGMFELAHGGTIFLDEIGDMTLPLQAKILRVLEEGEIFRVGGTEPLHVNVRVIVATNRNLKKLQDEGKFRKDLYYRINVINIEIPPLRQRQDDILPLAGFFLDKVNRKLAKNVEGFSREASELLAFYQWPGNIRELKNCIERAVIMAENDKLSEKELQFLFPTEESFSLASQELAPLDVVEKDMIGRALKRYGTSVEGKKRTAQVLNISLRTLYNKIKRYSI